MAAKHIGEPDVRALFPEHRLAFIEGDPDMDNTVVAGICYTQLIQPLFERNIETGIPFCKTLKFETYVELPAENIVDVQKTALEADLPFFGKFLPVALIDMKNDGNDFLGQGSFFDAADGNFVKFLRYKTGGNNPRIFSKHRRRLVICIFRRSVKPCGIFGLRMENERARRAIEAPGFARKLQHLCSAPRI